MEIARSRPVRIAFVISLILALLSITTALLIKNGILGGERPTPFQPTANVMADVDATLLRASESGKLGLIIMGANWCHDSQSLVARLDDDALKPLLDEKYVTLLVDVGGLEHVSAVIQRFGEQVIYGTPTVLIVDPKTETLINKSKLYQWRDAYSISVEETVNYFAEMAARGDTPAPEPENEAVLALLAQVDAFEEEQSKRIYTAFALIGPMVEMPRSDRPDNFNALWKELSRFRYQITRDLTALRAEAKTADASSELTFPTYKPFSWE
ncbi:MAG: hypothetical protein COB37_00950 [Kordiimonadales bacterium]|nr:MAG: hypothetical protein COB37_00950 [Kordiimonadales bacterium]